MNAISVSVRLRMFSKNGGAASQSSMHADGPEVSHLSPSAVNESF
jgi:hypothetical protein